MWGTMRAGSMSSCMAWYCNELVCVPCLRLLPLAVKSISWESMPKFTVRSFEIWIRGLGITSETPSLSLFLSPHEKASYKRKKRDRAYLRLAEKKRSITEGRRMLYNFLSAVQIWMHPRTSSWMGKKTQNQNQNQRDCKPKTRIRNIVPFVSLWRTPSWEH